MGIDTTIVGLLKAKDEKALSLLYDNYSEVLYGVCFQILKDTSAAEDALQESFIKIWKNSHTYDQKKAKLFTWILRITRNTAIDLYRKTNKTKPLEVQIGISTVNIKDQGFESDHLDIQNHMDRLAQKNKAVLEAIFFFGMTQREVADYLGIPLGTVKSRLRIGLKELGNVYQFKQ
ncbi:sigma-70 family RNA polymerase sigma factor [Flavobacteriaceae bacterium]|jgi:RNA polymerase sigma-70 factor (ECF subfamily)|nr:sigma-70 family RNA polymerase sigma factor [Flavobacteriaceae bacterium]